MPLLLPKMPFKVGSYAILQRVALCSNMRIIVVMVVLATDKFRYYVIKLKSAFSNKTAVVIFINFCNSISKLNKDEIPEVISRR